MDFAEDYKCFTQDEVQLAYWNLTIVTIHQTMIYIKQNTSLVQQSGKFCRLYLWCWQNNLPWWWCWNVIYLMSHDLPLNSKMQSFNWPTHADELRVKRNSMSLSNNKFTFTIQALIGSNVTYVIDVKQLYQDFCSFIFPINDDIWVHISFSQQSNFLQPWSTQVFYKLSKW